MRGFRSHEGEVVILADPDILGHFLNMVFTKGSTTGDATNGYTHPFTVGTPDSYTMEIKKGDSVVRYFGVRIDELKLDFADGRLQVTASVKAMGQVSTAKLGVALSGASTEAILSDVYDLAPNRGLVVGDKLSINGTEVTLTSVDVDGVTVGFSSTSITASVGAEIFLKPLTVTQPTLQEPFLMGNLLVGFGVDESDATSNAVQADSTPLYDLSISIKNNLFAQNGTNQVDPVLIAPQIREASIECKQLYSSTAQRSAWLSRSKQAITFIFKGKHIKTDYTTFEQLTLKCHNVKLIENGNPLNVGEFISDEQTFEVLYDNTDAKAVTVELINRSAGTVY